MKSDKPNSIKPESVRMENGRRIASGEMERGWNSTKTKTTITINVK